MATIPILRGSTGLNSKSDPGRLPSGQDTGLRPMCRAVNVLIDDSFRPARCEGYSLVSSGNCVAWGDGLNPGLAVRDDVLHLLAENGSMEPVASVAPGCVHISAVRWIDRLYWTTGQSQGFIQGGHNHAWEQDGYIDPDEDKAFFDPPACHLLEYFAGRMLMATRDGLVRYSEMWNPGLFQAGFGYLRFASEDVSLLAAVGDGFWVSDERGIYWLGGLDPSGWIPVLKADYPAVLGQAVKVPAEGTPYDNLKGTGMAIKAGTARGLVTLGAGGFIMNDTANTIDFDSSPWLLSAVRGAAGAWGGQAYFTYEP